MPNRYSRSLSKPTPTRFVNGFAYDFKSLFFRRHRFSLPPPQSFAATFDQSHSLVVPRAWAQVQDCFGKHNFDLNLGSNSGIVSKNLTVFCSGFSLYMYVFNLGLRTRRPRPQICSISEMQMPTEIQIEPALDLLSCRHLPSIPPTFTITTSPFLIFNQNQVFNSSINNSVHKILITIYKSRSCRSVESVIYLWNHGQISAKSAFKLTNKVFCFSRIWFYMWSELMCNLFYYSDLLTKSFNFSRVWFYCLLF